MGKENRNTISEEPIEGVVLKMGEEVGYLKPNEPVEHEGLKIKKKVYFHASDIEGERPEVGAQVIFILYKYRERGIGAESVQVTVQGDGTLPPDDTPDTVEDEAPRKKPNIKKTFLKTKGKF